MRQTCTWLVKGNWRERTAQGSIRLREETHEFVAETAAEALMLFAQLAQDIIGEFYEGTEVISLTLAGRPWL